MYHPRFEVFNFNFAHWQFFRVSQPWFQRFSLPYFSIKCEPRGGENKLRNVRRATKRCSCLARFDRLGRFFCFSCRKKENLWDKGSVSRDLAFYDEEWQGFRTITPWLRL